MRSLLLGGAAAGPGRALLGRPSSGSTAETFSLHAIQLEFGQGFKQRPLAAPKAANAAARAVKSSF